MFKALHKQFSFPGVAFKLLTASTAWFEPHRCWFGKQVQNVHETLPETALQHEPEQELPSIYFSLTILSMSPFSP
jgi:hypothetical protein